MRGILYTTREIQTEVLAHRGEPRDLIERAESALFRIGHDTGKGEMRSIEDVLHDEMDKLVELSRGRRRAHRRAVGLPRPRRPHGRLPEREPGRAGGPARDGKERHWPPTSPRTPPWTTASRSPCSRWRCPRPSSPTASWPRGRACRATSCARAGSRPSAGTRSAGGRASWRGAPIFIDDSSDIGMLELRAKARRLQARHGLGMVIVDYLQLMRPEGRSDSRVEQVGQISRGLKILARELDMPVVAISQLSRAVESRNPPEPMLSDLRESGQHRAGRRPGDVRLPRGVLQPGVRAAR